MSINQLDPARKGIVYGCMKLDEQQLIDAAQDATAVVERMGTGGDWMPHTCKSFNDGIAYWTDWKRPAEPAKPRIRIVWSVGDKSGHGEWFDISCIGEVTVAMIHLINKHGPGTHWLEEEKPIKVKQPDRPANLPQGFVARRMDYSGLFPVISGDHEVVNGHVYLCDKSVRATHAFVCYLHGDVFDAQYCTTNLLFPTPDMTNTRPTWAIFREIPAQ